MYSRWIFEVKEIRNFVCVQLVVIAIGLKEKQKNKRRKDQSCGI